MALGENLADLCEHSHPVGTVNFDLGQVFFSGLLLVGEDTGIVVTVDEDVDAPRLEILALVEPEALRRKAAA